MKNKSIGLLMVFFIALAGTAASEAQKTKTVTIQTNAICGDCKSRIEKELNYTKGVVYAELDLETKAVEVKYKTKVLSEEDLHNTINNLGYSTNKSKRNEEAFQKLPKCCQSPGHCEADE